MEAGKLKYSITVKQAVIKSSNFGGSDIIYEDKFTTRCAIKKERVDREVVNSELFYPSILICTIRSYHKVDESDIIIYKDKKYRILSIFEDDSIQATEIKLEKINE